MLTLSISADSHKIIMNSQKSIVKKKSSNETDSNSTQNISEKKTKEWS